MRISDAAQQYQRQESAQRIRPGASVTPQARVITRRYGVRVGMFGVDYMSRDLELDPLLSKDVRERKRKEQAFKAEVEVESLRAEVAESCPTSDTPTPAYQTRQVLAAYTRMNQSSSPRPGCMLTAVV